MPRTELFSEVGYDESVQSFQRTRSQARGWGLRPLVVLRQAGLPMGLFDQEKILVTTEELFSLYRGISEVSRDPAIGLKLGTEERIERYDPISIAALYARSFGMLCNEWHAINS